MNQSRYLCFFSALMPLTFHISAVSGTLVTFRFPLGVYLSVYVWLYV